MGYENGGCDCCNCKNEKDLDFKQWGFSVFYYFVGCGKIHYEKPRFCPMCGRDLRGCENETN